MTSVERLVDLAHVARPDLLLEQEVEGLMDRDAIAEEAVHLAETSGIIFLDEIDKICGPEGGSQGVDVSRQPEWDRVRAQSVWRRRIERLWTHARGSPGIYRRVALSPEEPS